MKTWLLFALKNFSTPVAFYVTFRWAGAKPAIALAILTTIIQIIAHRLSREKLSPFFIVASGFTVLFGSIDLLIDMPMYFRLEPAVTSLVLGILFGYTVVRGRPLIALFADALPASVRPDQSQISLGYMRKITLIWTFYFFVKAVFFVYIAFRINLGELILLRTFVGGGSGLLLILGEMFYRKRRGSSVSANKGALG